jgi:nitrogen fixation protein FixH
VTLRVMNPRHVDGALTGWHVLAGFIAFFGVIFAVNGYFLYSALSTHTGIVANEPYRKGLAYNERIAFEARQQALGWSEVITAARDGRIVIDLRRAGGERVANVVVAGSIGRPSTAGFDRKLTFTQQDGAYVADAGPLPEGNWVVDAAVRAAPDQEPIYRLRKRLWLKP